MSNVLGGFSLVTPNFYHITDISENLLDVEYQECQEILGQDPAYFLTLPSYCKWTIKDPNGRVVGMTGLGKEGPVACPWILFRKDFKVPLKLFLPLAKRYLDELMQDHDVVLTIKLATNTNQIRLLKALGFKRNPDVELIGQNGGILHEYIIRKKVSE